MILVSRSRERFEERKLRNRTLIVHERPRLRRQRGECVRVGSRLCEPEIDELEHRFQIFARTGAAKTFFELTNKWSCRGYLACQHLAQIDRAELANASCVDYLCRRARWNVVGITHKGCSPRTVRSKEDFVGSESRWFEYDPHSICELPDCESRLVVVCDVYDLAGRW